MTTTEQLLMGLIAWLSWLCIWLYLRMRRYRLRGRRSQYVINRVLISMGLDLQDNGYGTQKPSPEVGFIKKWYDKVNKLEKRKQYLNKTNSSGDIS